MPAEHDRAQSVPESGAAPATAPSSHAGLSSASGQRGERARGKSNLSFRSRVTLSFAVVALLTTVFFVVVLTVVWNNQFSTYTRETMEEYARSTADSIARAYETRGYWSMSAVQDVMGSNSLTDSVGVQVLDNNGVAKYDNTWILGISGTSATDLSLAPDPSDENMVIEPIVTSDGATVGTVRVWVYGSDTLLTPRDESFRSSSMIVLCVGGTAAVVLAAAVGFVVSRMLTKPVRSISTAAQRIKEGDLTARSNVGGSDDLGQLGETFDAMAESIEKDRELERRLTSDVAHELRTPLMSILATVEAMQDEVLPCDQEHLALVGSETKRLSRLVDSMLRLSRLENGSVRMHIELHDLVDFVQGIATGHRALLEEAGLEMRFENRTGADELEVEFDRDTLTQAVTNIVSNAMRYTPAPGSVTISVASQDGEARIAVADTGIGIAKEDINRVFGRFWRAEESRNRVAGGLGVGLAVTKEIIDRHHGRIEVASEQGVGTTFTLCLPLKQPSPDERRSGGEGHGR